MISVSGEWLLLANKSLVRVQVILHLLALLAVIIVVNAYRLLYHVCSHVCSDSM